jgi:hypothetical protein
MIGLLIGLLVIGLIVGLIWYVVDALPVPDPLGRIIKMVAVVVGVLAIILSLLQLGGYDVGIPMRRL